MSLLALTASTSIVAGVFVWAAPAYSDDGVSVAAPSCLVVSEEGVTVHVASTLHAGGPVHVEGSGWAPSSAQSRGFVVVTLDDGKEKRPAGMDLPAWAPPALARDASAWAVIEVSSDGTFVADIPTPASWIVGSSHRIAIGDGVMGTYVTVEVAIVDLSVAVRACSLTDDDTRPSDVDPALPDDQATSDSSLNPGAADGRGAGVVEPKGVIPGVARSDEGGASMQVGGPRASGDGDDEAQATTPSSSSSAPTTRPGSSFGSGSGGDVSSGGPSPGASPSQQQSVSASQIVPKARGEQQANEEAAREEQGRLNGWILAGGGLLALFGAVVTVSIVRRSHVLGR